MAKEFDLSVLFKVVDEATVNLKKIGRSFFSLKKPVDSANKSLLTIGQTMQRVGGQMTKIGKDLSLKVTAPITALGVLSSKSAIDLESSFAGVRKTFRGTEEELEKLRVGLRKMAVEEIPLSVQELDRIAESAGQLGIQTKSIESFTKVMAALGATTNLSSEEAASQLARFANITSMSQEDFDKLGATIVDLGNNFATTEAEIVEISKRLAGAGSLVGLTESQILGMGTALSSLGVQSEAGGTAFSQVMRRIDKTIGSSDKKMKERMRGFAAITGKTIKEFEKAWKEDAANSVVEFVEGLGKLNKAGKNVNRILDALGLEGIRISDSLLRAALNGDILRRAMDKGSKAWKENIALTKEARLRYETARSKLILFKNQIVITAASFGEILVPVLLKVAEKLKGVLKWFESLSPVTKTIITVLAAMVAVIGPLLVIFGQMAIGIGAIVILAGALGVSLGTVALVIGGVIAAVIALVAAGVWLVKNWDKVGKFFSDLWSDILDGIKSLVDMSKTLLDDFLQAFDDIFESIKSGFTDALSFLPDFALEAVGVDVGGDISATREAQRSETDINIKVTTDDSSTATIEKVSPKFGDANVKVATPGYVGAF
jgi:TP901 family phage tail tape measure protein